MDKLVMPVWIVELRYVRFEVRITSEEVLDYIQEKRSKWVALSFC